MSAAAGGTAGHPVVYTVGHSTRDFDELVGMLREHGITCLVDIRSFPSSRAYPQWNRAAIAANLPTDITYRWMPALGGRRHTPAGTPTVNDAWRVKAFRDYADHMATDTFAEGLRELLDQDAAGDPERARPRPGRPSDPPGTGLRNQLMSWTDVT
ncbi:DUF488 family protein [Streptomyces sp. NPDC059524]|uniref:DUF488 domain-containing protein n=1 Tax=Streptomyces sp. NPDC059524 TaxID=3346856 RepID=UPI00369381E8